MGHANYRSIAIAFLATIVRYYDYGLFGMSAAILSKVYFSYSNDENQMIGFFAIFSASVVLRPFGSIIFGRIGDKIGRVESVKIATILAAISTMAIGLIPPASAIGLWAAFLLTIARIVFLISLAGEIDAIKIYVAEMVGKKKRYFASSLVTFSSQVGVLVAAILYHYSQTQDMIEYFWRYNFIAGGLAGILVFLLRKSFVESEIFLKTKDKANIFDDMNIVQIIKHNSSKFTVAVIMNGMLGGVYHFLIIFLATFTGNVAGLISAEQASSMNVRLIAIYGLSSVAAGAISGRVCYYKQTSIAIILSIFVMLLMMVDSWQGVYSEKLHKILICLAPFFIIPSYIKIQSLFVGKVRMRMCSLSHSLGSMIFSSTTPLFCLLLWKLFDLYSIVLSFYMVQMVILLAAVLFIRSQDYQSEFEN